MVLDAAMDETRRDADEEVGVTVEVDTKRDAEIVKMDMRLDPMIEMLAVFDVQDGETLKMDGWFSSKHRSGGVSFEVQVYSQKGLTLEANKNKYTHMKRNIHHHKAINYSRQI